MTFDYLSKLWDIFVTLGLHFETFDYIWNFWLHWNVWLLFKKLHYSCNFGLHFISKIFETLGYIWNFFNILSIFTLLTLKEHVF